MNRKINRSLQFKNGSFSLVLTVIAIVLVIIINVIFSSLSTDKMTFSTRGTDLYSLSKTTKNVIDTVVDSDINLYVLSDSLGSYDDYSLKLCSSYADISDHIKLKKIDTAVNPAFTAKYEAASASDSSVIVENTANKKFIIVDFADMHQTVGNDDTKYKTESYNGEGLITAALYKVSVDKKTVIYQLGGHDEMIIKKPEAQTESNYPLLYDALDKFSYDLRETALDLSAGTAIPEDAEIILIFFPQSDLSLKELEYLSDYVKNGGKLAVIHNNISLLDGSGSTSKYSNFDKLFALCGLQIASDFIVENDYNHYYNSATTFPQELIIPDYTAAVSGSVSSAGKTMAAFASPLYKLENTEYSCTYTDLLLTSGNISSYMRGGVQMSGPVSIASISNVNFGEKTGSMFIVSDAMFFNFSSIFGSSNDTVTENNVRLFTEGLNKMSGRTVDTFVPVKSFERKVNIVAGGNVLMFSVIYMILIPLAVLAVGIVIWLMRRSR